MPEPKKVGGQLEAPSKSSQVRELVASGMSPADIAKKIGCTPGLVYTVKSLGGMSKKRPPNPSNTAPRGRQFEPKSMSGRVRVLLATGMSVMDISKALGCKPMLAYGVKARMNRGTTPKRGPGRPRKSAVSVPTVTAMTRTTATETATSIDGLASIIRVVQGAERERARLRAALEEIQALLRDALA